MFSFFFLALTRAEIEEDVMLEENFKMPKISRSDLKELSKAVITVLFKNGRCLNQINDISDAIVHSRSGCARDLPAGPKLYQEMARFQQYKDNFNPTNGKFFNDLKSQAQKLAAKSDKGTITQYGQGYLCWCITLGGYTVYPTYNLNFQCYQNSSGRYCRVTGVAHMSGKDYWDFDDVPSYGWLKNIVEEKIPKWLVQLRTKNMRPFYTKYNFDIPVDFTIKVN